MAELAAVIFGISLNIVSLFNQFHAGILSYINHFNRPVRIYTGPELGTRDPHPVFIVHVVGCTRPFTCAVASTKLHVFA